MCGRYVITLSWSEAVRLYRITEPQAPTPNLAPRYNAAPTGRKTPVLLPIIRPGEASDSRALRLAWWGLIPGSSKNFPKKLFINARAESLDVTWPWKTLVNRHHCLVIADGFYEWKTEGPSNLAGKQPYLFQMKDGAPFTFAGLWDRWHNPESGQTIESYTIIVTEANALVGRVHHRMPVIVAEANHDAWLAGGGENQKTKDWRGLFAPYPADAMTAHPVDRKVGNWRNDGPELLAPVGPALGVGDGDTRPTRPV